MTKAYERYLECREDLLRIRTQVGGGYWCEDEEPVIEEMDALWSQMESHELASIRAEGSWKFPPPPTEVPTPVRGVPFRHGNPGVDALAFPIARNRTCMVVPVGTAA